MCVGRTHTDKGLWGVVIALAVELTGTGQRMPGLEVFGYGFGRAESARGGAGCRAWVWCPLARPHENALALGVRWRAWGSASVGWVPDDTGFISSLVMF